MPDPETRHDSEDSDSRAAHREELRRPAPGSSEPAQGTAESRDSVQSNPLDDTDTRDRGRGLPPRQHRSEDPTTEPLAIGSSLGRFRLEKLIGQGGMGRVYEARDPRLRRQVAIKTLRLQDPASVHRFVREARLQASVNHPGICPVFEVGEHKATPYIVMQLLHGKPLDEASEGLHLEQKLVLVRRVAEAVHEAHRAGLIHRDLKPSNILVESNGPRRCIRKCWISGSLVPRARQWHRNAWHSARGRRPVEPCRARCRLQHDGPSRRINGLRSGNKNRSR